MLNVTILKIFYTFFETPGIKLLCNYLLQIAVPTCSYSASKTNDTLGEKNFSVHNMSKVYKGTSELLNGSWRVSLNLKLATHLCSPTS